MFKRTVFLFMSAALALPAIAAAKTIDVDGPLTLRGHGPLRAQLASADGSARVSIRPSLRGRGRSHLLEDVDRVRI